MGDGDEYIQLVKRAQHGDEGSLNRLAELAQERLRSYVYRLTLDEDSTQDITQESILEMLKFLDKLERADRFWPWLFRIAGNNFRDERGRERLRKAASSSKMRDSGAADAQQGLDDLVSRELKQVVSAAMMALKPRHRKVLILRCYEEMTYSDISDVMACSEFAARRLFHRAKRSLARQLSRRGLGKGTLVAALVLFGKMTAANEAAAASVSVTASTVKVGTLASLVAIATSKTAVVSLATVGVIAVGSTTIGPVGDRVGVGPQESNAERLTSMPHLAKPDKANEERWYYYPPNSGGAVLIRTISGTDGSGRSYCQWLHDDHANYYKRGDTIYIENHRMWAGDLSVQRLPTDSHELSAFLCQVEADTTDMRYVSILSRGALVIGKRDQDGAYSQSTHRYDVSNEENFRYNWQRGAEIIDHRDTMHKRGWTYFRISGQVGGKAVSGVGRMPFVYETSKAFSPWLRLELGDGSRIVDSGAEARVYDPSGKVVRRYKGGSFFRGLGRPWMGLHAIDTIRRDAAEQQIWFETRPGPESGQVEVKLTLEQVGLVYTIDMENDLIERIAFLAGDGERGELGFSYLQEVDDAGSEFAQPQTGSVQRSQANPDGLLWLIKAVENHL
jgi:RNA polymerase sigma-70 factor (ECF subfamily)